MYEVIRRKSKGGEGKGSSKVLRCKPAQLAGAMSKVEGNRKPVREMWAPSALSSIVASSHTWLFSS